MTGSRSVIEKEDFFFSERFSAEIRERFTLETACASTALTAGSLRC